MRYKWVIAASVLLTAVLIFVGSVKLLQDETPPQAIVKPTGQPVQFPDAQDIRMVYVVAGPSAGSIPVRNKTVTVAKIENWLKTAQPVSVQLPHEKNPRNIVSNAYTGPAVLVLQLSSKSSIEVSPAYYMWGHSNDLSHLYHYVDGVIEYKVGKHTTYFKDPVIYDWLKSGKWASDFVFKSDQTAT